MMAMMKCNQCGWLAPHDPIGIELMKAHLAEHDREDEVED